MKGEPGDLAMGDGFLGEVVSHDGGFIGLSVHDKHGLKRRLIYVPDARVTIVRREQERPRLAALREAELDRLTDAYAREHRRGTPDLGW